MKKFYVPALAVLLLAASASAQTFTNSSGLLPSNYNSGGVVGVTDMNNDGYDDIIIMDQSLHLYIAYQNANGTFTEEDYGVVSDEAQWGMAVGNMDNDDHLDVLCGGYYDNTQVIRITSVGNYEQVELDDPGGIFMQACNWGDINNDGWLDVFACHDDGPARVWINDGAGNLEHNTTAINTSVYPNSDNSGNYGSVFTDFDRDRDLDLFVAKCRQFINDPYDPRRTNIFFVNDGENNFIDEAHERGLVNLQQSWTVDFADVDNDGDYDCLLTTHSATLQLYLNDGSGYFTDVTEAAGLDVSAFFLQAKFADFDNDGFVDLVHSGGTHRYFHNNGNLTFTEMDVFPYTDEMHSFGIGDLNRDGHLDLYASYGDGYVDADNSHNDRLWLNNGNNNHFIVFDLEGTVSNQQAVGATVEIHGAWGVQIREVRAGESYGISNCFAAHFGLGTATSVDQAIVFWPSGLVTVLENPAIDSFHEVIEEDCTTAAVTVAANGPVALCDGGSVSLSLSGNPANYMWSNGAMGTEITVTEPGNYSVITWDNNGCGAQSNVINVAYVTDETPVITANGPLEFCEGGSVQLISSEANAYIWNGGEQTQAITVSESGTYYVAIEGICDNAVSEEINVVVFDAPDAPVIADVTIPTPDVVTLEVTSGADVRWYDSADATTPVGNGLSYTTPYIAANTSYWVEDVTTHGGEVGIGGPDGPSATGQYHNSSNYWNVFDANEDIWLKTVRVFAGTAGDRTIRLLNNLGATVDEITVTIPEGESVVDLNFFVPEGTGYGLRCTNPNPQLWRDKNLDQNYDFPYDLGGLASITGTTVQGGDSDNYYYFFYDWTVESVTFECPSDRVEVQIIVLGVEELEMVNSFTMFPNPASDVVTLSFDMKQSVAVQVNILDVAGRTVQSNQMIASAGGNMLDMDISSLAAGVYHVEFSVGSASASSKLVVR